MPAFRSKLSNREPFHLRVRLYYLHTYLSELLHWTYSFLDLRCTLILTASPSVWNSYSHIASLKVHSLPYFFL